MSEDEEEEREGGETRPGGAGRRDGGRHVEKNYHQRFVSFRFACEGRETESTRRRLTGARDAPVALIDGRDGHRPTHHPPSSGPIRSRRDDRARPRNGKAEARRGGRDKRGTSACMYLYFSRDRSRAEYTHREVLPERARARRGVGVVEPHAGVPARCQEQAGVAAETQAGDPVRGRRTQLQPESRSGRAHRQVRLSARLRREGKRTRVHQKPPSAPAMATWRVYSWIISLKPNELYVRRYE